MQNDNLTSFIQKVLELKEEKEKENQLFSEAELDNIAIELEIDPAEIKDKAQEHYTRGKNFMEFHNYEDAKKEFDEAIILQPNFQEVLLGIATTLQHLWQASQDDKLRVEAVYYADQVIKINPEEKNAYKIISYLKYEESSPVKKITSKISTSTNKHYKIQDTVRVYWFGKYYDATVTAIQDGKYKIHYSGYDKNSDEWISEYRILGSPANQIFKWTFRGALVLLLAAIVFTLIPQTTTYNTNSNYPEIQTPASAKNTSLKVGDKVQVLWNSSYYNAEILEISGGQYEIHYAGYSSSWDEWVTSERIK
jgi:hypothetical protein